MTVKLFFFFLNASAALRLDCQLHSQNEFIRFVQFDEKKKAPTNGKSYKITDFTECKDDERERETNEAWNERGDIVTPISIKCKLYNALHVDNTSISFLTGPIMNINMHTFTNWVWHTNTNRPTNLFTRLPHFLSLSLSFFLRSFAFDSWF